MAEATARGETGAERLLAIFDVFGEWFACDDFEGCAFVNVLLEFDDALHPVRLASVEHLGDHPRLRERVAGAGGRQGSAPSPASGTSS